MTGQRETPMSDHVARFWELLATEYVRILIDIRKDHDEGQPPHWDSASFPNDVAKALVEQHQQSMTANQIMDRYPWISEEDTKRIVKLAAIRAQQLIYEEAMRLKPR